MWLYSPVTHASEPKKTVPTYAGFLRRPSRNGCYVYLTRDAQNSGFLLKMGDCYNDNLFAGYFVNAHMGTC